MGEQNQAQRCPRVTLSSALQELLLEVLRRANGMLGIRRSKSGWAAYKARALPDEQSLQPQDLGCSSAEWPGTSHFASLNLGVPNCKIKAGPEEGLVHI